MYYNLVNKLQFDTIYHEHFSYLSVHSISKLFPKFDLKVFDIKKIKSHGGSLRIFVKHKNNKKYKVEPSVQKIFKLEKSSQLFSKISNLNLLHSGAGIGWTHLGLFKAKIRGQHNSNNSSSHVNVQNSKQCR